MTDYERIVNIENYRPKLLAQQTSARRIVGIINSLLVIAFAVGVCAVVFTGWGLLCALFSL